MTTQSACSASVRMTRAEYRYVEEIPGMEMWWTAVFIEPDHSAEHCPRRRKAGASYQGVHDDKCTQPTDKHTVQCVFNAGHDGDEHAALVGVFNPDLDKEPYLYWRPGIPKAREIRQPGLCEGLADTGDPELFCTAPANHPGDCIPNR